MDEFFAEVEIARSVYNLNIEQRSKQEAAYNNSAVDDEGVLAPPPKKTREEILKEQVDKIKEHFRNTHIDLTKLAQSDLEYILTMSDSEYTRLKSIVEQNVKIITEEGLTNSKYESGKFYYYDDTYLSIYEDILINDLIGLLVEPNVSVDVEATQKAMDAAVEEVKPVYYLKNQTIVSDGELVTEEQLVVLKKLNLIGNFREIKTGNVVAYLAILGIVYIIIGLVFLKDENQKFLANNYKLMFVELNAIMLACIALIPQEFSLFSPLFILVFILATLYNNFIAFLMAIVYTIFYALIGRSIPTESLYLLLTSAFTSVIVTCDIQRFRLVKISLIVSFVSGMLYALLCLIFKLEILTPIMLFRETLMVVVFVLTSMIFAIGVIPFLEASFGLLTPHRLQELINTERPVFKRMLAETPGTFHHSVVVANLCEAGAKAIKADDMLAKAYGYYHDIGKLSAPMYFIENQIGYNYHDDLECKESARVIKNHVDYGVQIRKEYKLPKFVDDAILSHHGTSILQYFYRKAIDIEKQEDVKVEDYTYHGFIPNSKELTVLMIADIVEAGVRSIIPKVKDFKEVEEFIDKVIDGKIKEGQFNDSNLTFSEIAKVKKAFITVLKGMYHNRITYPAQK